MNDDLARARQLGIKARTLREQAQQATAERDALVYKLLAARECSQAELGRQLGLTRESVRRIYDAELLRLERAEHGEGPG